MKNGIAFLFSSLVALILAFCFSFSSLAAPGTILYSGKLLDAAGNIVNGNVDMTLTVYTLATGGTALYVDRNTAALGNPVTVTDGIYSVIVGDDSSGGGTYDNLPQALAFSDSLYVQITIGVGGDLSPREKLQAVPYAVNSGSSDATNASRELTNLRNVAVNTAILPAADASTAFGSAAKRWTDVYLSGSLSNGSSTTTVANIATLAGTQALSNKTITASTIDPGSNSVTLSNGKILIGNASNAAAAQSLSGDVTVTNTGVATIQANSVALGTDTTGNYVATVADAGNGAITVAGSGSETAAVTLDLAANSVTTVKILDNNVTLSKLEHSQAGNQLLTTDGTNNPQWSANLPVASLPTGGAWTLSSNLNIDSDAFVIDQANNRVGIGNNAPTAALHLKAGTASANTAPLKLTSGTSLTTPEAGAVEYDGTNLYLTNSALSRKTVALANEVAFDPRTFSYFFDDFETATTTGIVWTAANTGTGADETVATVDPADNAQGVVTFSTGTKANGIACLCKSATGFILGKGEFTFEARVEVASLSTLAQEFAFAVGLHDATASDAVDGVYFLYDRTVSTNWQCVTSSNSTRTTTDSGVAVTGAAWVRLKAIVNPAGTSVTYFINDTSVATITTNIPIAAGRVTGPRILLLKSAGTTARTANVDYWYHQIRFAAAR
ncbi:MAG: hypothetical protein WC637_00910 [Victivallales bacterium]